MAYREISSTYGLGYCPWSNFCGMGSVLFYFWSKMGDETFRRKSQKDRTARR